MFTSSSGEDIPSIPFYSFYFILMFSITIIFRVKYVFDLYKYVNFFLVPLKKISTFNPPKKFIFTFGLYFKVNSYVEFIFLNKILLKNPYLKI